jgi:hypothetical protein
MDGLFVHRSQLGLELVHAHRQGGILDLAA